MVLTVRPVIAAAILLLVLLPGCASKSPTQPAGTNDGTSPTGTGGPGGGANPTPPEAVIAVTGPRVVANGTAYRGEPGAYALSASQSRGNITQYAWDLGDGATATSRDVEHNYTEGAFTIQLTVLSADGTSDTAEAALQVVLPEAPGPPPPVVFTDPSGDADAAEGDLVQVTLSDDGGNFTTKVKLASLEPTVDTESLLMPSIYLNGKRYEAYFCALSLGVGSVFDVDKGEVVENATVRINEADRTWEFTIPFDDIGTQLPFDVYGEIRAWEPCQDTGQQLMDRAPDAGTVKYPAP